MTKLPVGRKFWVGGVGGTKMLGCSATAVRPTDVKLVSLASIPLFTGVL